MDRPRERAQRDDALGTTAEGRERGHAGERVRCLARDALDLVVDVQLVPLPVEPPAWRPLAIAGGVGIGAGIVAVAVGAALIAIDERAVACTDAEANEFGVCPRRYSTLEGGAATVAIGGALLVTSIVLEAVAMRRRARGKPVARWQGGRLRF